MYKPDSRAGCRAQLRPRPRLHERLKVDVWRVLVLYDRVLALAPNPYHRPVLHLCDLKHSSMGCFLPLDLQ